MVKNSVSVEEIRKASLSLGFDPKIAEEIAVVNLVDKFVADALKVDELEDFLPMSKFKRSEVTYPPPAENPCNGWACLCRVTGTNSGKLAGRTLAVKDVINVSGVPTSTGSRVPDPVVPKCDATVVARILEAGGTILGKSNCEAMCLSGNSYTCRNGSVANPFPKRDLVGESEGTRPLYSAGGSSSGSAALVAAGACDMALGCDQGGSVRLPACRCGLVGMKPTFGLVPYTGCLGLHRSIDHCGPITKNVLDNALLLEVLAGPDDLDSRQGPPTGIAGNLGISESLRSEMYDFTSTLTNKLSDIRIGILTEGLIGGDKGVLEAMENTANVFRSLGVTVEKVSVPLHKFGVGIYAAAFMSKPLIDQCMGDGQSAGVSGLVDVDLAQHFQKGHKTLADKFEYNIKTFMLCCQVLYDRRGLQLEGKGINLVRKLRLAYNEALGKVDLLLLPTIPFVTDKIPEEGASMEDYLKPLFNMIQNTCTFNGTGHPVLTVPCGLSKDGLPIGMSLVGKHSSEALMYQVAAGFERSFDWAKYSTEN
eukprot:20684_1